MFNASIKWEIIIKRHIQIPCFLPENIDEVQTLCNNAALKAYQESLNKL